MKAEYFIPGLWKNLNTQLSNDLSINSANCELRVYPGLYSALSEISSLLADTYPHKKKSIFFKNCSPALDDLLFENKKSAKPFEEFEISILTENPEAFKNHLKDSIAVYTTNCWPLLGKSVVINGLIELIEKNRSYNIDISLGSKSIKIHSEDISKFQIKLIPLSPSYTVALVGVRAKIGEGVVSKSYWDEDDYNKISKLLEQRIEISDKEKVIKFEESAVADSKAYFSNSDARSFDRAVIYWEDMDASAVQEVLANKINYKLSKPGFESKLESTSPSRWTGYGALDWLEKYNVMPEISRGILIISSELIDSNFVKALEDSRAEVLSLQSGGYE